MSNPSYDSAKTRNLQKMVGGFASHPTGDFIQDLSNQLTAAEAEITVAANARAKAEGEANRYASELATMQATMRQLREENEALKAAAPAPKAEKKPRAAKAAPIPAQVPPPPPEKPKRARKTAEGKASV